MPPADREAHSHSGSAAATPLSGSGTLSYHFLLRENADLSNLKLTMSGNCKVMVTFDIENTGKLAGSTVGQVYVHQPRPPVEKPDVELAGFAKLNLAPGESGTASVTLGVSETVASY